MELFAGSGAGRKAPAQARAIRGLGPAEAISQDPLNRNPNSTVATFRVCTRTCAFYMPVLAAGTARIAVSSRPIVPLRIWLNGCRVGKWPFLSCTTSQAAIGPCLGR